MRHRTRKVAAAVAACLAVVVPATAGPAPVSDDGQQDD